MTLIEVLIAAFLLLVIALGVLPMFVTAMSSNVSGEQYTEMANNARARAEEFMQLPFTKELAGAPGTLDPNYPLNITAGTERVIDEYFSKADKIWKTGTPTATDPAEWLRTTTIRQYNAIEYLTAIESSPPATPPPLDASATPGSIHLKEITVTVSSPESGGRALFGGGRQFSIRVLKSQ